MINIFHLASFSGNVGDVVNHISFRSWFSGLINEEINWKSVEIRDFYRGYRKFDNLLIDEINENELLVVGGGNFFELWPMTRTGTSIDLPIELLEKIIIPTFWNSLGVDDGQGIGSEAKLHFENFIDYILNRNDFLLSLRNDGSLNNLLSNFSNFRDRSIHELPDHGFFISESNFLNFQSRKSSELCIGINLACDMDFIRYGKLYQTDFKLFAKDLALVISKYEDNKFVLIPHVYSDYNIFSALLSNMKDSTIRDRVTVVGLTPNFSCIEDLLKVYCTIDVMLAMRFHSNLIPMSLGIKTIGISSYPQITKLYEDLELTDMCVDVTNIGWQDKLTTLIDQIILPDENNEIAQSKAALNRVSSQRKDFELVLIPWLDRFLKL